MITLRPMTEADFAAFSERSLVDYAEDKRVSMGISESEAIRLAKESFARFLPDGLLTRDAHFYIAIDPMGVDVGFLWFNIMREWGQVTCFILDIGVYDAHRRKGHGSAILSALDPIAADLGATSVGLHVFGNNSAAIALYQQAGFHVTDLTMSKAIKL